MSDAALSRGLARVRRRRWFLWATILIYLPSIWASLRLTGSDSATAVVFGVWFVVLLVASCAASFARCPQCGNYFHVHGFVPVFARRCVHCGLHVTADRRPRRGKIQPSPPSQGGVGG
ncbi:MAG: hypothetical protein SCH98_16460 [Deferrisomatales bacterium]|nr:hypothetical protein [Deferrisomatales bacterium]